MDGELQLGTNEAGEPLGLPAETLLRHAMALGASGSGKTVFCKVVVEEAVRRGMPVLCIDPQGDLCSLGAGTLSDEELEAQGVDPGLARELRERAEVVVFTPGSSRGVPLCADPIDPALADLSGAERVAAVSRTAAVVVALLGFDLESDDGAGLAAVIDRALHELLEAGGRPSLAALTDHLYAAQEADELGRYARYLDAKKVRTACQRLARLDVGARRLLFHDGVPIDIDVLLGRDARAPVAEGKTRVAVVFLNTLHQQEDKDFFVAALADRLYSWMLAHPSPEPQALFYIDEVAPFIPPVRKPACKDGLSLLFKQARKYGVCCLMATQNPGDVDYRAMAQFGTWALGRLTTRQDLKKVEPTVKSLAPDDADSILGSLPSLRPGQLVLISPDRFERPTLLATRWLATRHETWNEERIEAFSDPLRARFDALVTASTDAAAAPAEPTPAEPPDAEPADAEPADAEPTPLTEEPLPNEPEATDRPAPAPNDRADAAAIRPTERPPAADDADAPDGGADADKLAASWIDEPTMLPGEDSLTSRFMGLLVGLTRLESATVAELAAHLSRAEGGVRTALGELVEKGLVRVFQDGRSKRYWTPSTGGRPDIGVPNPVPVIVANVDEESAHQIAEVYARSKLLGIIGEDESFERLELAHRLAYKLDFEERVERSLIGRLFGGTHDERLGSVYMHPHNFGLLVFENERGVRFVDVPDGPASEIRDFDGVTDIELKPPGTLAIDDADWTQRKPIREATKSFESRFAATPGEVSPLFVPIYHLFFRNQKGSLRRIAIDGMVGKPVKWLPPA